jgi:ubiquinone/menaquinone biosynthesis C-methylase UbiE
MLPFFKKSDPHALAMGMAGTKLGDHLAYVGCADGDRLAAIAAKVGLSGQAVAIVGDETAAARVRHGARRAGALIEVKIAPPHALPLEDQRFDVAVIDDSDGAFSRLSEGDRDATAREALRVLRPGGRALIIGVGDLSGLGALLSRKRPATVDPQPALLAAGFRATRLLGEREGLRFFEGTRSR